MKLITTYRQTACRLLAVLFFLCLFAPMAAGQDNWQDHCATRIANQNGGDGTSWDDAIKIASAKELAYFAQQVNSNQSINYGDGKSIGPTDKGQAGGFMSYYFALSADIDLSNYDWTPIGNTTSFNGNFDGRGHCVNGLKVMKVETFSGGFAYAGLFGYTYVGILRNLGVRLADAGIQVNSTDGTVYAGGIAGYAHKIFNCYVVGEGRIEIHSSSKSSNVVGGIVGYLNSDGSLANCYATVNVKVGGDGTVYVGGIVGYGDNTSTISHTYATGDVETGTGDTYRYAGGICGYLRNNGTLTNSLAVNGQIIGGNSYSNRIVGHKENDATLGTNYASSEIQVNGSVVNGGARDGENGDPSVDLSNFLSVLSWGEGWDTNATRLPQLKMQTGDGPSYTYTAWPTGEGYTPQSSLDAVRYLIAKFSGKGSSSEPYQITNRVELAYLAKQVNSGMSYKNKYFALTADIDLSAYYWTPIGNFDHSFSGNFDGCGHCVSGLKVKVENTTSKDTYVGLFGKTSGGILHNLGVRLADVGIQVNSTDGAVYAGGIAGWAYNIFNCYVEGEGGIEIHSNVDSYAGGIVGYLDTGGSLANCYATVNVKVEPEGMVYVGGIVGYGSSNSTISHTYATGDVETGTGDNSRYAGGICGYLWSKGTLTNSLAVNGRIIGGNSFSNRIVGHKESDATLGTNYASPEIQVNGQTPPDNQVTNKNGANTYLDSFETDLKKEDSNGDWTTNWTFNSDKLPQLNNMGGNPPDAATYLPSKHILHIVSSTGGTLKVTDGNGTDLFDDSKIAPGTLLTLSYTENPNYRFSEYLSGSSAD
uniref:GLUG motif-containing protein n=1 Tax=Parabacteroides goldsteinii TaxID=328812 RepID=UPI001F5DEA4F